MAWGPRIRLGVVAARFATPRTGQLRMAELEIRQLKALKDYCVWLQPDPESRHRKHVF